jgi:hypothetical protein
LRGKLNTFPGFTTMKTDGNECGKAVQPETARDDSGRHGRVEIHDDTCTWCEFTDGRPPIAVMPCDRRSPMRSDDLERVIVAWNAMVDPGE